MNESTLFPHEHVVFTDFDGVEGILVDLNTKKYYQLNETAMAIWKGLEGKLSPDEIASELAATYEISSAEALVHVKTFLQNLQTSKLVCSR